MQIPRCGCVSNDLEPQLLATASPPLWLATEQAQEGSASTALPIFVEISVLRATRRTGRLPFCFLSPPRTRSKFVLHECNAHRKNIH
ncbi:hypothetical protein J6590_053937 [Homalodisca vitripennis]|nr:hypothetical protein J6590_053937 [Homalodisca vitripennis]